MPETYGPEFAGVYDLITGHKDYEGDVRALDWLIRDEVPHPAPRILDVGCGTGTHAALLAERGYDVTGVEPAPDMARQAAEKAAAATVACGHIETLNADGFHFCCSLYNVVNCLDSLAALESFVTAIGARLADGALLLIEAWNPIAVLAQPPEVVERVFEGPRGAIRRTVVRRPDFPRRRLALDYLVDDAGEAFTVRHHLLLFTPLEIETALGAAGFRDVRIRTALPELADATADDRMLAYTCVKSG